MINKPCVQGCRDEQKPPRFLFFLLDPRVRQQRRQIQYGKEMPLFYSVNKKRWCIYPVTFIEADILLYRSTIHTGRILSWLGRMSTQEYSLFGWEIMISPSEVVNSGKFGQCNKIMRVSALCEREDNEIGSQVHRPRERLLLTSWRWQKY